VNLDRLDWGRVAADLDARGCATIGPILDPAECDALIATYDDESRFRSRVVMARHNYGQGEYRYLAYFLPETVARLRTALYPPLAAIANRWEGGAFPPDHATYLERCHAAGQTRPTPLILKYGEGDYNRLHQDLYGDMVFPLQATLLLSDPRDFAGGEFVMTETRPRTQSRVEVVPLARGEAVIFAVNRRPIKTARGTARVAMRHGVSRLRSGRRFTLGIIFHDAK
jgi:hypothetical protein